AVPLPTPRLAPVTTATLPRNDDMTPPKPDGLPPGRGRCSRPPRMAQADRTTHRPGRPARARHRRASSRLGPPGTSGVTAINLACAMTVPLYSTDIQQPGSKSGAPEHVEHVAVTALGALKGLDLPDGFGGKISDRGVRVTQEGLRPGREDLVVP